MGSGFQRVHLHSVTPRICASQWVLKGSYVTIHVTICPVLASQECIEQNATNTQTRFIVRLPDLLLLFTLGRL